MNEKYLESRYPAIIENVSLETLQAMAQACVKLALDCARYVRQDLLMLGALGLNVRWQNFYAQMLQLNQVLKDVLHKARMSQACAKPLRQRQARP